MVNLTTKLQELYFDSEIQLKIFFAIINSPKGITRDNLLKKLLIPRTTLYNNIRKLEKRKILVGPEINVEMFYVQEYSKKLPYNSKGRPLTLFYVPKLIRNSFLNFYLPNIEIKGKGVINDKNKYKKYLDLSN